MYSCDNYLLAVVFCVVTMFCWGSWGNTQKLAGKTWRYELFYWDYVIGVVLFALASGLTAGSCGGGAWSFLANLKQASAANLGSAFLGGIVFNAANILLAAAISIAGMSVAFPVGIGLALVLGVVVNWLGAPKGDPELLFGGVALIALAILCNAFAYRLKAKAAGGAKGAEEGTQTVGKGIALSAVCGVLMAFFYRFVARTMDMDFAAAAPQSGMMTPYSAFFVFALGIFASNFVFNAVAMRHPASGAPITEREYFRGGFAIHLVGVLGGLVWGLGNGINLVAAGKAGAAISYGLGQGATLVSALWGILVWKEFKGAPRKAGMLNLAMFVLFLAGLGAIIAAGESKTKAPVKVIFDTDMITDFDDVGALACLHALADAGECEILATVSCTRGNASVGAIEIINRYYGRPGIPVGCAKETGVVGAYAGAKEKVDPKSPLGEKRGNDGGHDKYRKLLLDYPGWFEYADSDDAPDANEVYRRVLAAQPDGSVVICSVGFLTNLRRLLETKPDAISPLDGKALVAKKVKRWVAMACKYPAGKEYNSKWDPESSRIALENWPTPVVFTDFEYGKDCFAGRAVAESGVKGSPVADVFAGNIPSREEIGKDPAHWLRKAFGMGGRAAWDETAVLIAVRGTDGYFNVERGTYRMTGDDGSDEWAPDAENGPHLRVTEKLAKAEVARIIDELMLRPPANVAR